MILFGTKQNKKQIYEQNPNDHNTIKEASFQNGGHNVIVCFSKSSMHLLDRPKNL